ncbi:hypothetical protein B0H21DRAFT_820659 [Amylocystis lapponica]|nr:hypothetical protein B0H21DRAFT_820659 [Amylocystis lapponica]
MRRCTGAWLDFDFVQITNESLSAAASTPVAPVYCCGPHLSEAYACAAIDSFTLNFHLHVVPLDYSSVMPEGNYIAQLTEEPSRDQPFDCQRPNCTEKHFEPGTTEIHYIESANPSTEGIWVCDACNDYYGRKSGRCDVVMRRPRLRLTALDLHLRSMSETFIVGRLRRSVGNADIIIWNIWPKSQPTRLAIGTDAASSAPAKTSSTPPLALPGRMPTGYTVAHREYADIRDAVLSSVTQGSVRESVILDVQLARRYLA